MRTGITIKLFILFTVVALIPIIFMSLYTFYEVNRMVGVQAGNRMTDVGTTLVNDINRYLTNSYLSILLISENAALKDREITVQEKGRILKKIRDFSPDILGLMLVENGVVVAKSNHIEFPEGTITLEGLVNSSPMITKPFDLPGLSEPAFLISAPIDKANSDAPSVLIAAITVKKISEMASLIRIGDTGRATILNDMGKPITVSYDEPISAPFTDREYITRIITIGRGIIHFTTDDNRKYLSFVSIIPRSDNIGPRGLRVVLVYEEDEAYMVAHEIRKSLIYAFVIIIVATSLVAIALSDAISRPIKELTRGTEKIARGEFTPEISVNSTDEMGELSRSFNHMARELKTSRELIEQYNRHLEGLVEERSKELFESERRYRIVVEGAGDSWVILGDDGIIKFANARMGELLGEDTDSLVGRGISEFIQDSEDGRVKEIVERLLTQRSSPDSVKFKIQHQGGEDYFIDATISKITDGVDTGGIIACLKDVTQVKALALRQERLHLELMERAKHSQIGVLTEGLFHNLNNPLQGLVGMLKVISDDVEEELMWVDSGSGGNSVTERGQELLTDIKGVYDLSRRLSEQVKNIMNRVRNEGNRGVSELDINQIVTDEIKFLEADLFFKHKVKKKLALGDDLPTLYGVYSDISQSFVNIILNAIDAIKGNEKRELTITTSSDDEGINITFHDTGCGIDKKDIPRIFEPFFTTRDNAGEGWGTGLGLFTVDFLLKPYGVQYKIVSRVGDTSFTIIFPLKKQ